jgi:hypothetical protein
VTFGSSILVDGVQGVFLTSEEYIKLLKGSSEFQKEKINELEAENANFREALRTAEIVARTLAYDLSNA